MEIAIQVIWWIGFIWAVIATGILLKQVSLLVGELLAIRKLAEFTRDAAAGMGAHSEQFAGLDALGKSARELHESARRQAEEISSLEEQSAKWRRD
jgi:hypothetical protein